MCFFVYFCTDVVFCFLRLSARRYLNYLLHCFPQSASSFGLFRTKTNLLCVVVSILLLKVPPSHTMDPRVKESVSRIPLMRTKAGPRDGEAWTQRLKEEYESLITFVENNKASDNHWFQLESNAQGTRWYGKCWQFYKNSKYEFDMEFDLPVTYPQTAPEIALPALEGKTVKMYRGGKICMTTHFHPLWARNVPYFGISHALALGLGPWLSVEVPAMVEEGVLKPPTA